MRFSPKTTLHGSQVRKGALSIFVLPPRSSGAANYFESGKLNQVPDKYRSPSIVNRAKQKSERTRMRNMTE